MTCTWLPPTVSGRSVETLSVPHQRACVLTAESAGPVPRLPGELAALVREALGTAPLDETSKTRPAATGESIPRTDELYPNGAIRNVAGGRRARRGARPARPRARD